MTRSRWFAAASVTLTALFLSQHAIADEPAPPPTPAAGDNNPNTALALQKFDEGRAALEAGKHAEALAAFEASNRLLASPNSLLYMARCHKALGHTASAFTTFRLAYKQAQDRLVATGDKRYIATRDTASKEAAEIEADVPKLAIVVPPNAPAGLTVKQNGANVSRESWGSAIDTDPGRVVVEATGPRLKPFKEEIDLATAETKRIDVQAVRIPTSVVRVRFASRPMGLAVTLDGQPLDPNELAERELDPGQHAFEVTAPGYRTIRWQSDVRDGETTDLDVKLEVETTDTQPRKLSTPRWMFFAAGGTAVAALGVGTVLAIDANNRSNDEQDKNPLVRDDGQRDTIRTESTIANVLFIGGAIFAIGTGVLAFTTEWKSKERPAASARAARLRWTGFGLGGQF